MFWTQTLTNKGVLPCWKANGGPWNQVLKISTRGAIHFRLYCKRVRINVHLNKHYILTTMSKVYSTILCTPVGWKKAGLKLVNLVLCPNVAVSSGTAQLPDEVNPSHLVNTILEELTNHDNCLHCLHLLLQSVARLRSLIMSFTDHHASYIHNATA